MELTIAIPIYNASKYLDLAIKSVLNQTYKDFELWLVNDGSTDNSMQIVESFNDKRIKIINDGCNKGLQFRLNQIISLVESPYMARMDSDDIMDPRKIEIQMNIIKSNSNIDVLGTNVCSINEINNVVGIRNEWNSNELLSEVSVFTHPTVLGKSQWFKENNYNFEATRIEDVELWYRTKKKSVFFMVNEPLFYYREEGGSYYKKYFKSLQPHWVICRRYNFSFYWIKALIKASIMGCLYFVFNLFGKESLLLKKRNKVLEKKSLNYYQKSLDQILETFK